MLINNGTLIQQELHNNNYYNKTLLNKQYITFISLIRLLGEYQYHI